jgi:nitrate reductase gamma subunit
MLFPDATSPSGVRMTLAVYIAVYAGLLIFVVGCIRRVREYASLPIHLRWELYPVPHEEPDRVAHGGSYFESGNWWSKPRRANPAGELRVMLPEILFLKGLWEFNRRLWLPSFLFHWGLYLSIATGALCAGSVGLLILAPSLNSTRLWPIVVGVYHLTGYAGAGFTILGAALLLVRRATAPEMKNYTKAADFFNLALFIIAFTVLLAGYILRPVGASGISTLVTGLARFDTTVHVGTVFGAGLVLVSMVVAYIPFTHMAHFIAKYFTYHAVRWDDQPNVRGSSIESKIAEYLTYRPTWSAAHVGADGKKNWVEVATSNPAPEVRK